MDVDPYKMMGVPKNFTPDQLRSAYRAKALAMHPDKQGGNDYLFKLLTQCYRHLVKEYNKKVQDKQFNELKTASKQYMEKPTHTYVPVDDPKKSFNIDKFNKIFEENQLPDAVRDTGYKDWLKTGDENANVSKMKGKFTLTAFNQQFNEQKVEQSKHLVKYKEPEPLFTGKKIQFTELGVDNVDDFSGDNMSKKNLNYMDLKLAHTTSKIVDPSTVKERRQYNTVGDVEADRANISYAMSEKDMRYYQEKKRLEELKEKQRLASLTAYDTQTALHHERLNRLMLGGR